MFGILAIIGLKNTLLPDNIICSLKSKEDFETTLISNATSLKSSDDCNDNEIDYYYFVFIIYII